MTKNQDNLPDQRIIDFIHKHHVMTLATCASDEPYCCNLFYSYLDSENRFVFTSDKSTRHMMDVAQNCVVAGAVVLETSTVGKLQGLQFQGLVLQPEGELLKEARQCYLKRFPYAILMDMELWVLEADTFKMTDNRLGFGKKLHWKRTSLPVFDSLINSIQTNHRDESEK